MKYVGKRATKKRANATEAYLKEGQAACGWRSLNDLRPDRLRQYLDDLHAKDAGAAALNERIICWVALGNWLAGKRIKGKRSNWSGEKRLAKNPFEGLGKYDDATDRRPRRALNESELSRLLVAAAERPLIDAQMIRRGPRKGELGAALKPETAEKLKVLVRECALIYQTMILTGMRKGELASITIGQCVLDSDRPFIDLSARNEKSREGNDIPIRADLAAELLQWIYDKQATNRPAVLAFKKIRKHHARRMICCSVFPMAWYEFSTGIWRRQGFRKLMNEDTRLTFMRCGILSAPCFQHRALPPVLPNERCDIQHLI